MSKHSPAPWMFSSGDVSPDYDDDGSLLYLYGADVSIKADGRTVCSLTYDGRSYPRDAKLEEIIANGHLIAAAPELLEALRYCKGKLEQIIPLHTSDGAWKAAHEAIAKATGGAK